MCEGIIDPEGQREDVDQICRGQIDHKDHILGLLPMEQHQEQLVLPPTVSLNMCLAVQLCTRGVCREPREQWC